MEKYIVFIVLAFINVIVKTEATTNEPFVELTLLPLGSRSGDLVKLNDIEDKEKGTSYLPVDLMVVFKNTSTNVQWVYEESNSMGYSLMKIDVIDERDGSTIQLVKHKKAFFRNVPTAFRVFPEQAICVPVSLSTNIWSGAEKLSKGVPLRVRVNAGKLASNWLRFRYRMPDVVIPIIKDSGNSFSTIEAGQADSYDESAVINIQPVTINPIKP